MVCRLELSCLPKFLSDAEWLAIAISAL